MEAASTDATAEFHSVLNDPSRWVIKKGVPVFKTHQRTDPATGQLIKVDLPKLYRIASNIQKMERGGGVPLRLTLGHTEPGKAETEQPPVGGYYRNARVARFGPSGEPAVVVDEWLDPQYLPVRKNFPYRSAEYYDDTEQITGVALLTRDPYLDLGVVAYTKSGEKNATYYQRADGRAPVMYHFLTGESPMATPNPQQPGTVQNPPTSVLPPQTPPQPQQFPGQQPPTPYAQWPLATSDYHQSNMAQKHPSNPGAGAVYGNYSTEPPIGAGGPPKPPGGGMGGPPGMPGMGGPPGMGGGMPGQAPGGPGGQDSQGLGQLHHHLSQAVEHLSRYLKAKRANRYQPGGTAGQNDPLAGPFPGTGPMSGLPGMGASGGAPKPGMPPRPGMPGMNARYADDFGPFDPNADSNPRWDDDGSDPFRPTPTQPMGSTPKDDYARWHHYNRGTQPMSTISGRPVGQQMREDRLAYQLQEANRAIQLLMYERDQNDSEWCLSEIRRLAAMGYQVGEYEVQELKSKPREQRGAYLEHICSRYQRVPVEAPPAILGDPTPWQEGQGVPKPATREEMEAALKMAANSNDPNAYHNALMYIRSGGQAPASPRFAIPPGVQPQQPNPYVQPQFNTMGEWNPGAEAQQPSGFVNPYPEPGMNGDGYGGY